MSITTPPSRDEKIDAGSNNVPSFSGVEVVANAGTVEMITEGELPGNVSKVSTTAIP